MIQDADSKEREDGSEGVGKKLERRRRARIVVVYRYRRASRVAVVAQRKSHRLFAPAETGFSAQALGQHGRSTRRNEVTACSLVKRRERNVHPVKQPGIITWIPHRTWIAAGQGAGSDSARLLVEG